ncbi:MAG: sulfide-dependent adenosine diphosphate thiazole synthase [Thermoprotei archaeon]
MSTQFPEEVTRYSEAELAKLIIEKSMEKLKRLVDIDVVIVGAGLAGLTAAWFLALNKLQVLVVDRSLRIPGAGEGGTLIFPVALIEEGSAAEIARNAGITLYSGLKGIYVVDPVEAVLKIGSKAVEAGASIWLGVDVEDLITRGRGEELEIKGVLIGLTRGYKGLRVNPIYVMSKATVDATGYECRVIKTLLREHPEIKLRILGASSGNVWEAAREIVERTGMVLPGLYVTGLSVAELYNTSRTGPLIGALLVSGRKVAIQIMEEVKSK